MINPNWRPSSTVTLSIDGRTVGEIQSVSIEPEPITASERHQMKAWSGSAVLTASPSFVSYDLLADIMEERLPKFDIVMSEYLYLPPRKLRSKKKRVIRKWKKKYSRFVEGKIYRNCTIERFE